MRSLACLLAGSLLFVPLGRASGQQALDKLEGELRGPTLPASRSDGAARPATQSEPGYLGVFADDSQKDPAGLRLVNVVPGGPAAKAGLKVEDFITGVDGHPVRSMDDFAKRMVNVPPGGKVTFTIRRGGEEQSIDVVLGRRPATAQQPVAAQRPAAAEPLPQPRTPASARPASLGVRVLPVTEDARLTLGVPTTRGAMVVNVTEGSAAAKADIPLESVIVQIDGKRVDSPTDAAQILSQAVAGQTLKVGLYHRGELVERQVTLEAAPASSSPTARKPAAPASSVAPSPAASSDAPRPFSVGPLVEDSAGRVEQLERRVAELEQRLETLQQALEKVTKDLAPKDQPLPEPGTPEPE